MDQKADLAFKLWIFSFRETVVRMVLLDLLDLPVPLEPLEPLAPLERLVIAARP